LDHRTQRSNAQRRHRLHGAHRGLLDGIGALAFLAAERGRRNGRHEILMKRAHKSNRRSLWSAGAPDRFGRHLRILQAQETIKPVGFLSIIAGISKWTTKAVPSAGAPKAAAISYS